MAGDRPVLLGLVLYLLVAAAPTVLFWVALRLIPAAVTAWVERRRQRRQVTAGPTLESVVADLRRLRREVCHGAQRTQVRRVALQAAYDDTLMECCRLVEVDAPLAVADGRERAFARLLTEAALEDAGIALDPPGDGTAAA